MVSDDEVAAVPAAPRESWIVRRLIDPVPFVTKPIPFGAFLRWRPFAVLVAAASFGAALLLGAWASIAMLTVVANVHPRGSSPSPRLVGLVVLALVAGAFGAARVGCTALQRGFALSRERAWRVALATILAGPAIVLAWWVLFT